VKDKATEFTEILLSVNEVGCAGAEQRGNEHCTLLDRDVELELQDELK
jgi:hypothetical protein